MCHLQFFELFLLRSDLCLDVLKSVVCYMPTLFQSILFEVACAYLQMFRLVPCHNFPMQKMNNECLVTAAYPRNLAAFDF